jgi:class 3 adenylate cyclase/tetratricopeptide (TPR) repeat protein
MSEYDSLVGERKNLTVLFADIVGSTARVDNLDAEDASQFLGSIVGQLSRLVTDHGGTVIHRLGDGIIAVFGAPVAVEDHAVRACHAALAMQRTIQSLKGGAREAPTTIRVGINTGEAVVRPDPLDVFGIMMHVASRLQSNANPGEIWISRTTLSAVGTAFTCSPLGFKSLKNVQQPVEVYALEQARQIERPRFGLEHWSIDVPFVGRAREKAILTDSLRNLSNGSGCILGIWGDAGIGKSRLLEEVKGQAGRSLLWLEGSGTSLGRSISYLPILQIVRRYIGSHEEEDTETLWNKLSESVRELFGGESDEVLPYLASFMSIPVTGELSQRVAYLDGEAMGRQVRRSLRLFFQKMARRKPTVLVLEDFYWADESSSVLLEHLFPLTETDPLAICFIGRGESDSLDCRLRESAKANHSPAYVEVALKALEPQEGAQLFDELFSGGARMARLRETILASAEGNPLFIEEVVRTLLETKALVRDPRDGNWVLTADVESIRIPATIQDLISARVDRLPENVKFVLTVASVIGKAFLYKVLRAITERSLELDEDLANLLKQGFIGEHARDPELEYIFQHAVIQEVTYDCILRARRRQMHQKVAEALELLFADNLDEMSGALAYHFGRAEIWERAQEYLFKAGAKADRLAADAEALHHYQLAVDACRHAFGDRINPLQLATIERKLGEAYYRRGEHDGAFRHFERALDGFGGNSVRRETSLRRPLIREILVQLAHLAGLFRVAKKTPDFSIEDRAAIHQMMGWMYAFDDPARLLLFLLIQLNEAERHSYAFGMAVGSAALVYCCDIARLPSLALRYHKKAARAAVACQNPLADCMVELMRGWHLAYGGDATEAVAAFAQAAQMGWQCGDLRVYGSAIFGQSLICCQQGRLGDAWALAKKQLEIGEETADRVAIRTGMLLKGMVLARTGRWHEGESALRDCLNLTESSHDYLLMPVVASELGSCLARQNRMADADAVFATAEKIVTTRGLRGHSVVFLKVAAAEAQALKAERLSAVERTALIPVLREVGKAALQATKGFRTSRPQALRISANGLWLAGQKDAAMSTWDQAKSEAARIGSDYEVAQVDLSVGRLTKNPERTAQGNEAMKALLANVY